VSPNHDFILQLHPRRSREILIELTTRINSRRDEVDEQTATDLGDRWAVSPRRARQSSDF